MGKGFWILLIVFGFILFNFCLVCFLGFLFLYRVKSLVLLFIFRMLSLDRNCSSVVGRFDNLLLFKYSFFKWISLFKLVGIDLMLLLFKIKILRLYNVKIVLGIF